MRERGRKNESRGRKLEKEVARGWRNEAGGGGQQRHLPYRHPARDQRGLEAPGSWLFQTTISTSSCHGETLEPGWTEKNGRGLTWEAWILLFCSIDAEPQKQD